MKFAIMPIIPIFPIEYYVLAILFAIVLLGYFLLKKENRRLKVVGGIIIVAIIIVAVMSMNAPDGSVNTLTKLEPTDEGTYEVELVLSPAPIEPNKETGLRMRYVQAGKDIVQQHVDYSLFIEKEGNFYTIGAQFISAKSGKSLLSKRVGRELSPLNPFTRPVT